jgi:hypothetical protein
MQDVSVEERAGNPGRAANAGDKNKIVQIHFQVTNGSKNGLGSDSVPATRAIGGGG